jgi:hypothetical protein
MPRKPLAAVLLLGAVLGALVAGVPAAHAAPSDRAHTANRGWDTPPRDVFAQLD